MALAAIAIAVGMLWRRLKPPAPIQIDEEALIAFAHSNDMVALLRLDGVRIYASPACERVLGYTPEEMTDQTPIARIHPDDRARVEKACRSLLTGVEAPTCTYRQQHKDGHYLTLEATYRLVVKDGTPTGFVASTRDISHRNAAERKATRLAAEIEESARLLAMAETAANVGHWRLNVADGTIFWSPEVYRIHGVTAEWIPNLENGLNFYHPDDVDRVTATVSHTTETGEPWAFDARLVRPSGEVRWVASTGQAERAANGEIVGIFGVFQDITERIETLEELVKARDAARELLATRSAFVATMSHEIRTPLTSILATVSLLQDAADDADRARYMEILERSCTGLSAIVDDVLVYSKLDEAQIELDDVAFDLNRLAEDVVLSAQPEAARKSLTVKVASGGGNTRVEGDPVRVQRILANLVSNAVKFTSAGQITLSIRRSRSMPGTWHFEVRDTGVGIAPDRIGRIFDPFVQADASITRKYGGTGLGLSICKTLVEAMGGTIGVESMPGKGSRFWFDLPLPPAAPEADALETATEGKSAALHILLAEDNDTNRFLISELLRRAGQDVVAVTNGAEAVEAVFFGTGAPFDLVLMDVHMPVLDGIAATRAIRARSGPVADLPIYAITADISTDRLFELHEAGITGVLGKPVKLAELEQVLRDVAGNGAADVPADAGGVKSDAAVIDTGRLDELDAALGRAARDTLMGLLIDDLGRSPARIRALVVAGQLDHVRGATHSLRGAVSGVGGQRMIDLLLALDAQTLAGAVAPDMVDSIDAAAADLVAAIRLAMRAPS